MTTNGKQLRSAELQDELIRIDAGIAACKQDESEAHALIRSLARTAVRADPGDSLKEIRSVEKRLGEAKMAHRRLYDAKAEVEAELAAAIAQEGQARREADAKEAETFSDGLPNVFSECDRTFAEFHRAFRAAIDAVNHGRSRGWNLPSQELLQSKLVRALRTWLSVADLRMLDLPALPSPERCTFASLGEAYALSVRGGAKHSVKPPPVPPIPTPPPAVRAVAAPPGLPPHRDVGVRLPGDGPDFQVRIPAARS
jgi:hypothetical protein